MHRPVCSLRSKWLSRKRVLALWSSCYTLPPSQATQLSVYRGTESQSRQRLAHPSLEISCSLNQSHQDDEERESRSNLLACFSNYQIDLPARSPQEFDFSCKVFESSKFVLWERKSTTKSTQIWGNWVPLIRAQSLFVF